MNAKELKSNPFNLDKTPKVPGDPFCLGSLLLNGQFINVDQLDESLEIHRKEKAYRSHCDPSSWAKKEHCDSKNQRKRACPWH